jgi:hypothetical protein
MMTLEEKPLAVVCWCICRKTRKAGEWIMKHGLTCKECMNTCFKEYGARYMEYRCEEARFDEEEHDYFEDFGEVWE